MQYSDKVMDHFLHPRNVGEIEDASGVGESIHEALALTNKSVAEALDGLPPVKMHCSVLAEQAIKAALVDYAQKNNIEIPELEGFEPDHDHDHGVEDED